MIQLLRRLAFVTMLFALEVANAERILPANSILTTAQQFYSDNGLYYLVMQSDGNLVYYRKDGVVRFATYQSGSYAVMQTDGNFVEYTASNIPVWNSVTQGNPGAFLAIQNDGNLVVYNSTGTVALWAIGSDSTGGNPRWPGDVVGRDMFVGGQYLGHLGLWDGNEVVEVGPYGKNAIRYTGLSAFKGAEIYWGSANAYIPDYSIYYCFQMYCPNLGISTSGYEITQTRLAIWKRAYQAYITGADYTLGTTWVSAGPSWTGGPLQRGSYRCDTFVLDMLAVTVKNYNSFASLPINADWKAKYDQLLNTTRLPRTIFNKLKSFE